MTTWLFSNNATSFLRQDTAAASITLTVPPGEGARFPAPVLANDEWCMVTIEDRRTGQLEICRLVGRVADVLTVQRAQEGTTAQNFAAGSTVSNRMTAGTLRVMFARSNFMYAGAWDHPPVAGEMGDDGQIMPNPIPEGLIYFNTTDNTMYVWNGAAWSDWVNAVPLDGSKPMTGDLQMAGHRIVFVPVGAAVIIDGNGGTIDDVVIDGGTF